MRAVHVEQEASLQTLHIYILNVGPHKVVGLVVVAHWSSPGISPNGYPHMYMLILASLISRN